MVMEAAGFGGDIQINTTSSPYHLQTNHTPLDAYFSTNGLNFTQPIDKNYTDPIPTTGPNFQDYDVVLNTTALYDEYYNYTDLDDFDFEFPADACFDIDCIWQRARVERIPVLRPLTFILSFIGVLGLVGNIMVILVFSKTARKRTSTYLILMLAIVDLIACALVIPGTLLKEWFFQFKVDIICKSVELLRNCVIICSAMILAAIALDRFLLVYRKTSQDGSKPLTVVMVLVTVVTGIGLGLPPMLGVGVYMDYIHGGVLNVKVCLTNYHYISKEGLHTHWQVITALFGTLITIIILLYLMIYIRVYKHSSRTKGSNPVTSNIRVTAPETQKGSKMASSLPFVGLISKSRNNKIKPITLGPPGSATLSKLQRRFNQLFSNKVASVTLPQDEVSSISTDSAIAELKGEAGPSSSTTSNKDLQTNKTKDLRYTMFQNNLHFSTNQNDRNLISTNHGEGQQTTSNQNPISPCSSTNHGQGCQTMANQNPSGSSSSSNQRIGALFQSSNPNPGSQSPSNQRTGSWFHSTNHKADYPLRNCSPHKKTTKVLCIITVIYIASFLPMFLTTHRVIEKNEIVFYLYFINNAANPVIYSFMNTKFRQDTWKMFSCSRSSIRF